MTNATLRAVRVPHLIGILLLLSMAIPVAGCKQATTQSQTTTIAGPADTNPATGNGHVGIGIGLGPGGGEVDAPAKPVPEPGTMALVAMGLVALGGAVRRRRSS